ncbi:putative signal peptide protein [Puccinia sorghi]|uniref:Putative signal peptide protein n=1 Tax=Puccinia sorghi TaxID=27349 RepID=A0A0L6VN66_9BASI|nr:putative signal peptide protein [Puccinia sorghi]
MNHQILIFLLEHCGAFTGETQTVSEVEVWP